LVKDGKAEGMILGILLAKLAGKDYVGFVDADNYMPGAVHEYVENFAAGFTIPESPFVMVRNAWLFKPKILGTDVYFKKWGRVSELTNQHVNSIISAHTHFETEVIKTANAGEHALSMPLASILPFASGFAVEPYELMFIFEQFGGIKPTAYKEVVEKGIDIYQIETRNPHFHKEKGDKHVAEMLLASLAAVYYSSICDEETKKAIRNDLARHKVSPANREPPKPVIYPPIKNVNIDAFREAVKEIIPAVETMFKNSLTAKRK
jgi:mannosyl-3-phosphoglycerate synthase